MSAALAKRYWPGQAAVGKRIKLARPDGKSPWLDVVGVAADVRYREWQTARYDIYIPMQQRAQHRSDFVVRTSQDRPALSGAIKSHRIDADTRDWDKASDHVPVLATFEV